MTLYNFVIKLYIIRLKYAQGFKKRKLRQKPKLNQENDMGTNKNINKEKESKKMDHIKTLELKIAINYMVKSLEMFNSRLEKEEEKNQ